MALLLSIIFSRSLSQFTYAHKRRLRSKAFFLDKYNAKKLWAYYASQYYLVCNYDSREMACSGLWCCALTFGCGMVVAAHSIPDGRNDQLITSKAVLQSVRADSTSAFNPRADLLPQSTKDCWEEAATGIGYPEGAPSFDMSHAYFPVLQWKKKTRK